MNKFLKEALHKSNPFMFVDGDGRYLYYENARLAYKECIKIILREFPLGFVDIGLLMMKYQRLSSVQVYGYLGIQQYVYLRLEVYTINPERLREQIRTILRILLLPSKCIFDNVAFEQVINDSELVNLICDKDGNRPFNKFVIC